MIKRGLFFFGGILCLWFMYLVIKFFLTPYFMPRIYIENKVGEKIKIFGPQYEKGLGDSLENFDDFNVIRTFVHPVAYMDSKDIYLGFWRRYFSSKETIEWSINWFYADSNKPRPDENISWIDLLVDEKGDYCQIKLILTTEGIEVIPLRKNYCFKKIHLPPKFG